MSALLREPLPYAPLLRSHAAQGVPTLAELHRLPGLGPRFAAVLSATARFLYADFLDGARDDDLGEALARFYEACVSPPLHADVVRRRAGFLRFGLSHLLRGTGPLGARLEACLSPAGAYFVPGLGPSFWSAVAQGLSPGRHPAWTALTAEGARRLGLARPPRGAGPGAIYSGLAEAHARLRACRPGLTALHFDHFLSLVAVMQGRNLRPAGELARCPVEEAVRAERARSPLREKLKKRGKELAAGQERLERGLAARDGREIGEALALGDPGAAARAPLDWAARGEDLTLWVGRLWEADDPYSMLNDFWQSSPLPGAGLWLPAAVLHLRDPQRYLPFDEEARAGQAALDDGAAACGPAERYRLFNEGAAWLRARHSLHPLELPGVLAALGRGEAEAGEEGFGGLCADTFRFLEELGRDNRREWMEASRERYRFAVREPLAELCRALARNYVGPVLEGRHGWRLDTEARNGRALTSIVKNDYGRSHPYNTTLWIAFSRAGERRTGAQLFVRVDARGLRYGLRLGREARGAADLLRANVDRHGEAVFRALRRSGALEECNFGPADGPGRSLTDPADLRAWAGGRSHEASRELPAGAGLATGEGLVGEVMLTFDRLLPAFACALEADVGPFLAEGGAASEGYGEGDFLRDTYLGADWLARARELLTLKRQLILQGVPGTGKTHVARCLARLLAGGRDEAVRLVQFHPAYSYEELVEGIKARSVAVGGRHDVTYPVEDGVLCAFAAEAAASPAAAHVLVIDEINRGNLPRIFGELLYLLEHRDQAVVLPYSRRAFRLPANLYLVATMNGTDRSVTLLDQALRRRFSFLEMPPDARALAAWLRDHPSAGPGFAEKVVGLFERLNAKLRAEVGPHGQVGHSYFMVPGLDEARLRVVWRHQVLPVLEEHFVGQPGRLAGYEWERLWEDGPRRPAKKQAAEVGP